MTVPPDFTLAKNDTLDALFADLEAHFRHELELMEGNYGLTGEEDEEEIEISGEIAEWQEIRNAKAFLARIAAQKLKL